MSRDNEMRWYEVYGVYLLLLLAGIVIIIAMHSLCGCEMVVDLIRGDSTTKPDPLRDIGQKLDIWGPNILTLLGIVGGVPGAIAAASIWKNVKTTREKVVALKKVDTIGVVLDNLVTSVQDGRAVIYEKDPVLGQEVDGAIKAAQTKETAAYVDISKDKQGLPSVTDKS